MKSAVLKSFTADVETEEQEALYADWLRAQVQEALDDPRPGIPHDAVMAEMHAIIAQTRKRQAGG